MSPQVPGAATSALRFSFRVKRLYRPGFVLMGLAVALALFWAFEAASEIRALRAPGPKASLPAPCIGVKSLGIKLRAGEFAHIGAYRVWGLQPPRGGAGAQTGEAQATVSFAQKEFNNVPAVYSLADPKYRWEFYGVVEHGGKQAVFFNPAKRAAGDSGWRRVAPGQHLDDSLALKEIGQNRAVIVCSRERKSFVLELFRVDRPVLSKLKQGAEEFGRMAHARPGGRQKKQARPSFRRMPQLRERP